MKLKINIQARLKRHARNSPSLSKKRILALLKKIKFFSLFIVIILPIYPSLWVFGFNEETAVGNYDETTIITAYEGDSEDSSLFSKESGFIKSNGTLDDTRDVSGINKLLVYTVQNGDSLGNIAEKFNVSVNSIIWANNFNKDTTIHPNDIIKIPPVTGLVYTVVTGDTIEKLATKYKIPAEKIAGQNKLAVKQELLIGQEILIPGAIKISPPKAVIKKDAERRISSSSATKGKIYTVGYTGKWNRFAWGNCTYFVANHKNITWRGNAKDWLRNATVAWVATGKIPAIGAIIVFQGSGYNPYYGHVGLVVDIDGNEIVVKDMNYRKLNEVTIRKISKSESAIKGYIYAN